MSTPGLQSFGGALLLAAVAAACGGGDVPDTRKRCTSNQGCARSELCTGGFCTDVPDAGGSPDAGTDPGATDGTLIVAPSKATVSTTAGATPPAAPFKIANMADATVQVTVTCAGATPTPSSSTLSVGQAIDVSVAAQAFFAPGTQQVSCSVANDLADGFVAFALTVQVGPDATPPAIAITGPAAGATLSGMVALSADASDAVGVASVEFFAGNTSIGKRTSPPWTLSWNTAAAVDGAYTLTARAADAAGNSALSAGVAVTVANVGHLTLSPPSAVVKSQPGQPTPGASFQLENDGTAALQYSIGCDLGTPSPATGTLAASGSATVSIALPTFGTAGSRTATCTATTADGTGGPRAFTINILVGTDSTPPVVSVTKPGAGAIVFGSATLLATATDGVGVTSVDFSIDGSAVASSSGPTFQAAWDSASVGDGSHTVTATAHDAAGNSATSAPISITVNNSRPPGASISVHLTMGLPDTTVFPGNPSSPSTTAFGSIMKNASTGKHQYARSYNSTLQVANWTSWELSSSWFPGTQSRTDNFRPDDTLPAALLPGPQLGDYSGSGYDRGHMCPSGDRTIDFADNSNTFYLTNMVPQAANNNQGPWEKLESYSRTLASSGKELFIISGPLFEDVPIRRTSGNPGVAIPTRTWKVIVVLDSVGQGPANVTSATRVIGVLMPNDNAKIAKTDVWTNWCTKPRFIEQKTGLDFLSDVAQSVQDIVETRCDPSCSVCREQ